MKALAKYPARTSPVTNLRKEMDRIFNDLIPFSWRMEDMESDVGFWSPTADMIESDNEYLLQVDLPGLSKKDISINYHDNVLTVEGDRKEEKEEKHNGYLRQERYFGSFRRSFMLPAAITDEKIKAAFKDGVLKITIPKAEKSKRKSVTIE